MVVILQGNMHSLSILPCDSDPVGQPVKLRLGRSTTHHLTARHITAVPQPSLPEDEVDKHFLRRPRHACAHGPRTASAQGRKNKTCRVTGISRADDRRITATPLTTVYRTLCQMEARSQPLQGSVLLGSPEYGTSVCTLAMPKL